MARRRRRPGRRTGRRADRPRRRRLDLAAHAEGGPARHASTPPTSPRPRRSPASRRPRPRPSARTGRPRGWSRRRRPRDAAATRRPAQLARRGTVSGIGTTVRVLGRAGVIRPYGPRTLADIGLVVAPLGHRPGRRLRDARGPLAPPGGDRRRARRAHLGRAAPPLQLAGPRARRARRGGGRLGRRHVPQPPRLHRRLDRRRQARRRHPLPQHRLRRPAARRRARARGAEPRRPRRGVHRPARRRPRRAAPARVDRRRRRTRRARDARAARDGVRRGRPAAARPPRPHRDPHLRHHRHAQGRAAQGGRASTPPSRCSRGCRCAPAGAPTSPRRSSTPGASRTSRWRCCSARPSCCAARFDPADRAAHRAGGALPVDGGDPGDAAADAGARARACSTASTSAASRSSRRRARPCRRRWPRRGWTASATTSTTSTARPRWPTPRSRRPRTCAPTRRSAGKPPYGTVVKILDEDGTELPAGGDRPDLRRQRAALRGLHQRRLQGGASTA